MGLEEGRGKHRFWQEPRWRGGVRWTPASAECIDAKAKRAFPRASFFLKNIRGFQLLAPLIRSKVGQSPVANTSGKQNLENLQIVHFSRHSGMNEWWRVPPSSSAPYRSARSPPNASSHGVIDHDKRVVPRPRGRRARDPRFARRREGHRVVVHENRPTLFRFPPGFGAIVRTASGVAFRSPTHRAQRHHGYHGTRGRRGGKTRARAQIRRTSHAVSHRVCTGTTRPDPFLIVPFLGVGSDIGKIEWGLATSAASGSANTTATTREPRYSDLREANALDATPRHTPQLHPCQVPAPHRDRH